MSVSSNSQILYEAISNKALSIYLNVSALRPTSGDGNCFYQSIIDALSETDTPYHGNHIDLWMVAVSYIVANLDLDHVQNWRLTIDADFSAVIQRQCRPGSYANELFIRATAIILNTAILFTKDDSTLAYPFDCFLLSPNEIEISTFHG